VRNSDEARERVRQGVLRVTADDLSRMFENSVQETLKLIRGQILQVKGKRGTVRNIFMSGGFGENPYLLSRVRRLAKTQGIEVDGGKDCWAAVAKGAAFRGAGLGAHRLQPVWSCPRHYGICVAESYTLDRGHEPRNIFWDTLDGRRMAKGQMIWLICKGDLIFVDSPTVSTYDVYYTFSRENLLAKGALRLVFVATGENEAPSQVPGLSPEKNELINLEVPLSNIPLSQRRNSGHNFKTSMTVKIEVWTTVKVTLTCGDVEMTACVTAL